ncbi:MAG TPA: hypothetical protein VER96_31405 [Polyangiaceae bacterium]|nr:hypothetical protein [Polyangiaceae bacterium]
MTEQVACLHRGRIEVLRQDEPALVLESPYLVEREATLDAKTAPRIVSLTRGRTSGELCYAISTGTTYEVFAQIPGTRQEQRLFHGVDARLSELDFSPADEALACTVAGSDGTSAIGVLSDDGKGLRTVTEGDVIDRAPRWVPGGRQEIVYASAGIGRTQAGKAVGRTPFALHRLRFADSSVEVLIADAHFDHLAVVFVSSDLLYALRRAFDDAPQTSIAARFSGIFRNFLASGPASKNATAQSHDLVRITPKGPQVLAREVFAFDVGRNEDLVYANQAGVFRIVPGSTTPEQLSALDCVEQLVSYW